jgi:hypothetical protein
MSSSMHNRYAMHHSTSSLLAEGCFALQQKPRWAKAMCIMHQADGSSTSQHNHVTNSKYSQSKRQAKHSKWNEVFDACQA